jgi:4'-phosphopantetheinyl transferase
MDSARPSCRPTGGKLPAAGHVHVWRVRLHESRPPDDVTLLSNEERDRAARFLSTVARQRFVAGRVALRTLLAHYTGVAASALRLVIGVQGKPALASPQTDPPLYFNLSHSDDLVVLVFAAGRTVGIDVEHAAPLSDLEAVAQRFFAHGEVAALAALPPAERTLVFYRIWTRKEAWIKLHGGGLAIPLASFSVSAGEQAALLAVDGVADAGRRWALVDLSAEMGAPAALAVEGAAPQVDFFEYPADLARQSSISME